MSGPVDGAWSRTELGDVDSFEFERHGEIRTDAVGDARFALRMNSDPDGLRFFEVVNGVVAGTVVEVDGAGFRDTTMPPVPGPAWIFQSAGPLFGGEPNPNWGRTLSYYDASASP